MFVCIKAVPRKAAYMTPPMEVVHYKQHICEEVWLPIQAVLVQFAHYHRLSHKVLCENIEKFGRLRWLTALHHLKTVTLWGQNEDSWEKCRMTIGQFSTFPFTIRRGNWGKNLSSLFAGEKWESEGGGGSKYGAQPASIMCGSSSLTTSAKDTKKPKTAKQVSWLSCFVSLLCCFLKTVCAKLSNKGCRKVAKNGDYQCCLLLWILAIVYIAKIWKKCTTLTLCQIWLNVTRHKLARNTRNPYN